ncbi:N-acetyltransferase [uncultured Amaricoccus sp.]|uniref:GNAT family N-acetyltransferase n=1 Tax=uncultured Amaricoccus sp. TaxID=339341 RepID=UPI002629583B|nr:N-acetyltransferase [uncultured Amaricoccus sp.]
MAPPETTLTVTSRRARPSDAADLARFIDLASEGLASHVWAQMAAPGEDPIPFGADRAARDEGVFSWRNATMAEVGGSVAGGLVAYRIGAAPEPLDDLPPMFRPLQALENQALGTRYVLAIATDPTFRRRGVARHLMVEAESAANAEFEARGGGPSAMSLIVADGNTEARRLYQSLGYREAATAPIVKDGWSCDSDAWLLMIKPLG